MGVVGHIDHAYFLAVLGDSLVTPCKGTWGALGWGRDMGKERGSSGGPGGGWRGLDREKGREAWGCCSGCWSGFLGVLIAYN